MGASESSDHTTNMKFILLSLFVVGAIAVPARRVSLPDHEKIVGGSDATPGEFPYQISFQDTQWGFAFHFCGGSILDEDTMITAAHCVHGKNYNNPKHLQIVAGEHNMRVTEGHEQTKQVRRIIIHENYSPYKMENDIALLKLSSRLSMNTYVQPVALPRNGQQTTGTTCVVSGWGSLSEGGSAPAVLQKVNLPSMTDAECRRAYGQSQIFESNLCCGYPNGGKDSCQGDSGGPLYCNGYQAGVVSWGIGCARPGYPGVYTEVSYFIPWINLNR